MRRIITALLEADIDADLLAALAMMVWIGTILYMAYMVVTGG